MESKDWKKIVYLLGIIFIFEALSLGGFFWPILNQLIFVALSLLVLVLSIYRLPYGLLLVLLELVVGSKGYLFYWPLNESSLLSLRLTIWSIFMAVFAVKFVFQIYKQRAQAPYWLNIKNFIFLRPVLFLGGTIVLGLVSALIYKHLILDIFFDFNAWLYFLLIIPLVSLGINRRQLTIIFLGSSIWLSIKTLILLAVFSHNFFLAPSVYSWLRKTLVGEMTITSGWSRVFIQSQIFPIIAYFFLLLKVPREKIFSYFRKPLAWLNILLLSLFMSTVIISLSRSFWVGFAGALAIIALVIWSKQGFKSALKLLLPIIISLLISILFIFLVSPRSAPAQLEERLVERVSEKGEAAVASRWALLPELIREIGKNPISGQGFGAQVTYYSQDPRVLAQDASGLYTTYAFEWGYLDIWLKIGLIGLIAYLWWLYLIIKRAWLNYRLSAQTIYVGLIASLVFLAIINIFTPYLNHPLGIGFIIVASCLIPKDRVY